MAMSTGSSGWYLTGSPGGAGGGGGIAMQPSWSCPMHATTSTPCYNCGKSVCIWCTSGVCNGCGNRIQQMQGGVVGGSGMYFPSGATITTTVPGTTTVTIGYYDEVVEAKPKESYEDKMLKEYGTLY